MAVHRVGGTLLLDELDIQELFMRSSQVTGNSHRISLSCIVFCYGAQSASPFTLLVAIPQTWKQNTELYNRKTLIYAVQSVFMYEGSVYAIIRLT